MIFRCPSRLASSRFPASLLPVPCNSVATPQPLHCRCGLPPLARTRHAPETRSPAGAERHWPHANRSNLTLLDCLFLNSTEVSMIARGEQSKQPGIGGMATVAEAAKLLGVSPRRVLQFIEDGRLRAHRVTPRLYVLDRSEVEQFAKMPRESGNPALKKSQR